MKGHCKDCAAWDGPRPQMNDDGQDPFGYCHRHAPMPYVCEGVICGVFAVTGKDYWCLEFMPKARSRA